MEIITSSHDDDDDDDTTTTRRRQRREYEVKLLIASVKMIFSLLFFVKN